MSTLRQLQVVESDKEYRVAFVDNCEDWVATFDKTWPEAQEWAANMAYLYNRREGLV
ncbi:hypothetical protein LLE49_24275 [Alicyclobacillus tolerans]|uniref:hypothetical protein n=1 Tax=Alicyclobacillus tolerans TaxID=90970 RepID=UPI001F3B875C|nr:hypothetical protein [Alicyclobacillus tolerans]MCF8567842.1 hypothetical protein [Alicyclobacillus tolerans]